MEVRRAQDVEIGVCHGWKEWLTLAKVSAKKAVIPWWPPLKTICIDAIHDRVRVEGTGCAGLLSERFKASRYRRSHQETDRTQDEPPAGLGSAERQRHEGREAAKCRV